MGGLDPAKILVILVLALIVMGPERLPKAARDLGRLLREFAAFRTRLEQEVRSAMPDVELPQVPVIRRGGITNYITGMMRENDQASGTAVSAGDVEGTVAGGAGVSGGAAPAGALSPNGIPASWVPDAQGNLLPGSPSLTPLPTGAPEAILPAEIAIDLDDPSWN